MRLSFFVVFTISLHQITGSALAAELSSKPERIGLWNKKAPLGDGKFEDSEAWLTVHRGALRVIQEGHHHR